MANVIWADAISRKKRDLQDAKINALLDITDYETFEAWLHYITSKYAQQSDTALVREKLLPHLEHIKSFAAAISSCTQASDTSALIWGSLLVVIECACRFSKSLDNILDQIIALQSTMPLFESYLDLYPSNPGLQFSLRDLYEDYLDYCIEILKHVNRGPVRHMFKNLITSSPAKELEKVRSRITRHKGEFEQKAEAAHRRNAEKHYGETVTLRQELSNSTRETLMSINEDTNARDISIAPIYSKSSGSSNRFIHTITLRRNNSFTGRDEELRKLHEMFNESGNSSEPKACIINGIGGVGKTQLALEYTYRYQYLYGAIFWLRTENLVELAKSYSAIGNKLGIVDDKNEGRRLSRIAEWLETTRLAWLIVMDNLENYETVATVWPITAKNNGSIIITSQHSWNQFPHVDFELPLHPLNSTEGSELLLTQTRRTDSSKPADLEIEIAKQLAISVGGLPLWIAHLSGFISQSQCSVQECLDLYRSSNAFLDQGLQSKSLSYITPGAVFDLAISRLNHDAKNLLYILAYLSPDGVPEDMLIGDHDDDGLALLSATNRQRFFSAIASLRNSLLVKREGQNEDHYLTTHRSLQTVVQHKLNHDTEQRTKSFGYACTLVRNVLPRPSPLQQPESEKWPHIERHLPQLLSLKNSYIAADSKIKGSLAFAELLSDIGLNVWDRGLSDEAKSLMLTAERALDSIGWDSRSMERSNIHVLLGILTDTVGITQRDEGLRYRQSAYNIRKHHRDSMPPERLTLDDDIRFYNTVTDLACSYQQYNRYSEIKEICETVIKKYCSWGTEDDFPYEHAKYYHHMAFVFVNTGNTAKAAEYATRAYEILKKGNFGLLATVFRFDCATILFQNGQSAKAISEHKAVLETRLLKLGKFNSMTLHSYIALGVIYYFSGDYQNAKHWTQTALDNYRKGRWSDENLTRAKFYLSLILEQDPTNRNVEESLKLHKEASEGLRELLPDVLPDFLHNKDDNDLILYDYLVPWTYRVVVQTQPPNIF